MSDLYQSKGLQLVLLIRPSISILFKLGATRSLINIITQFSVQNAKSATVVKLTVVPCPPVVEVKIKRPDTKYQLGFSVQNGVVSVNFHMSIKLQNIKRVSLFLTFQTDLQPSARRDRRAWWRPSRSPDN